MQSAVSSTTAAPVMTQRINVSTTTSVYLVLTPFFSGSGVTASGLMFARRSR